MAARAPIRRPVADVAAVKTVEEGCVLLQAHVEDGSLSTELYAQLPNVLTAIFGVEGRRAWVDSVLPRKDMDALYRFLNAQGPLMNLVMNNKDEDSFRFEVPIKHVPNWMRKVVAAQIQQFYGFAPFTTSHVYVLQDANGAPNPVLILNILEYFVSALCGYCQNSRPPLAADPSPPSGAIASPSSSSGAGRGVPGPSALSPRLHLYPSASTARAPPPAPVVRPYFPVLASYLRAAYMGEEAAAAAPAPAPGKGAPTPTPARGVGGLQQLRQAALARAFTQIAVEHWLLQARPAGAAAAAGAPAPQPAAPAAPALAEEPYLQPTPELLDAVHLFVLHLHAGVTLPALAAPEGPSAALAAELSDLVKVPLHGFLSGAMSRSSSQTVFLRAVDIWCSYLEPWAAPDALADWMSKNLEQAQRGAAYPPRKVPLDNPAAALQSFAVSNFAFYVPLLGTFVEKVAAVDFAVLGLASLPTHPMYQKLLQVLRVFASDGAGGAVGPLDALSAPDAPAPADPAAQRLLAELQAAGLKEHRPLLQGSGAACDAARRLLQNLRALRGQELASAEAAAAASASAASAAAAPGSPSASAERSPAPGSPRGAGTGAAAPSPSSGGTPSALLGNISHSLSASLRSLGRSPPGAGSGSGGPASSSSSSSGPRPPSSVDGTCRALESLFRVPHAAAGGYSAAARPAAAPLYAEAQRGRLTREGVAQLRTGKRLCSNLDVPVLRDPTLVPVSSTEIGPLVRALLRASAGVNSALALGPYAEAPPDGVVPRLSSALLPADRRKRMRANLRPLADVRNQAALALAFALFAVILRAIAAR
eukprot:tig00000145_g8842.t1